MMVQHRKAPSTASTVDSFSSSEDKQEATFKVHKIYQLLN